MENYEYRLMKPEEKEEIIAICKSVSNPSIKQFPNYWTRFKNWERNPPYVLIVNGKIAGFTALTFQKRGVYSNHYAFCVRPELQRQGFGGILWEIALKEAKNHNCKKIKTKAHEKYSGYTFFTKLGWEPIGKEKHDFIYEIDLENINNLQDFINEAKLKKYLTKIEDGRLI
jgi:GNAT superfamily N-acetyltransferase